MKAQQGPEPQCALCGVEVRICQNPDGKGPRFCPTRSGAAAIERARREYEKPEVARFARMASIQEAECYANRSSAGPVMAVKPRVQETIEFAHKMGYKKLGLAFCAGLKTQALVLARLLAAQGFDVASVICKIGAVEKGDGLHLAEQEKISPGCFESMCNPIAQAMALAEEKTDFNIVVGLCVGHDSLFLRYSEAPCTVLVVKDRVTGHNPLAAIMLHDSYYKRLGEVPFGTGGPVNLVSDGPES